MNSIGKIRNATTSDAKPIASIYNHYIENTVVSFEETPVAEEEMAARIEKITARHPWLLIEDEGAVAGYAYAGAWHARSAYRYTVESTVYLSPRHIGRGLGTQLMQALLSEISGGDARSVIAGVALPNDASVRLHEKLGYRKAARYAEVGFKFGQWIDVGYWQLMLSRA